MSPSDVTLERTLPNSIESERAVLGDHPGPQGDLPGGRDSDVEDFYLEDHREIFRAMLALAEDETSIDLITLRRSCAAGARKKRPVGPHTLLPDRRIAARLNVGHYARTVREKATSRQLIQLSSE